jgi:valyl-tRNA synthetase
MFKRAYPVDFRQQGHDIIRTWYYYSTLRCSILTGRAPFKGVLVNGHILGPDGSRMSKSKGNVILPEQGVNVYGADAIRQALMSLTLGSDFPFKWEPVKYSKSFLQKVWSSVRFSEGFLNDKSYTMTAEGLEDVDLWILSRLKETVEKVGEAMEGIQFHLAVDLLQKFYWHDVCDQYVEALKPRLYNPRTPESQMAAKKTLYYVIWIFCRTLAPFCPHITEEIYQSVFKEREGYISIHASPYPKAADVPEADGKAGAIVVGAISGLRTKKVEAKLALSAEVPRARIIGSAEAIRVCKENDWLIKEVLHIMEIAYAEGEPAVGLGAV